MTHKYPVYRGSKMFAQLFGKYLVEHKEVTKEQWQEVMAKRFAVRARLGVLAVEEGLLSTKQANELNRLQLKQDKKFGDLAIEKGYLSEKQIESLLIRQGSPYMQLLQVIVENTGLSLSRVSSLVTGFQKELGFTISEMTAFKNDNTDELVPVYVDCDNDWVKKIAAIALRNLTRFISNDYYIEKVREVQFCDYKAFACQTLESADREYRVLAGLLAPDSLGGFKRIAEGFLGDSIEGMSEKIVIDAAGEFINCTSGLFATAVSKEEKIELEIMPQEKYEDHRVEGHAYILPIFILDNEVDLFIAVNEEINAGGGQVVGNVEKNKDDHLRNGKGRILIVDDSAMSRQVLKNLLEDEGYVICGEAEDGEDGVSAFKRLSPDLVTLDITMPKKDGLQALKEIREYDQKAKVIMITAVGQENKIIEALKLGAEKFLTKPFDKNAVRDEIGSLLK